MTIAFEDQVVDSLPNFISAYRFVGNGWVAAESPSGDEFPAANLILISWNVNAKARLRRQRLLAALFHIKEKPLCDANPPPASCILLQEVHADALPTLLSFQWVRDNYLVTPVSSDTWKNSVGLVTLISKDVPVSTVFTVGLPMTSLGRQALFIDLHISTPSSKDSSDSNFNYSLVRTIRIANTHLESGASDMDLRCREKQLDHIARMLNVPNIDVFICVGSMCSITKADKYSPAKAGFADAYRGRHWGSETWGHHPVESHKPSGRLDKILYFPVPGMKLGSTGRVGVVLKLETPVGSTSPVFVSDHTGVWSTLKLSDPNGAYKPS